MTFTPTTSFFFFFKGKDRCCIYTALICFSGQVLKEEKTRKTLKQKFLKTCRKP